MIGITYDITDRKNAEAERLEIQRQLLHAQKLESLGILAGGIAHDFNNLLTVMLGQGNFALKRLPAESPLRGNLQEALQAARRAADLTRQMLAYSGKGSFILEQVDLCALIEENARLFRSVVPRTIAMDLSLAQDLPRIRADRGQIQQVAMNLISNATEAIGQASGTITLTASLGTFDEGALSRNRAAHVTPGRFVCLTVTDTGCGMDAAAKTRLFDPFFTTKFTGRGLGMAVVLGVVKRHKGAILVDSTPGEGTTIQVLFPVAEGALKEQEAEAGALSLQAEAADGSLGKFVLLVDDEQAVRNLCKSMLESLGYEVLAAADGQEAVAVFRKHAEDIGCVLLDVSMPRMDGRRALAALKGIQPGVKAVLMSGYGETEATASLHGSKAEGFLQKPFGIEDLKSVLRQVSPK